VGSISRYIFRTTMVAFLITLVTLTVVIWFTQAMRDFDLITSERQTLFVFIGITGMIVPLLIGAILQTICARALGPDALKADVFTKSFTGGLLTGAIPLLAVFYVCLGSTIEIRATGYILKKGAALWGAKFLTAAAIALLIRAVAPNQNDVFLGLSALAIVGGNPARPRYRCRHRCMPRPPDPPGRLPRAPRVG